MVLRLYSGFERSVAEGTWQPTGVPTIYRLIEALVRRQNPLRVALAARQPMAGFAADRDVSFAGLPVPFRIFAPPERLPAWLGRLRPHLAELGNAWKAWRLARRFRPEVIYVDRGSLWVAGLLCRLTRWPIVYRVMGISDALTSTWQSRHPLHRWERWLMRSRFAAVICSQDGSGGEVWLPRLFRRDVPTHMLVNGVDRNLAPETPLFPAGPKTRVGFVGRFEPIKGSVPFLQAFLRARAARPGKLQAIVIGTGPQGTEMESMVAQAGARDDVLFVPSLPHRDMRGAYESFDVYVSLNRQGNLSNANLEAFSAGRCTIVPRGDTRTGRDVALDALFPTDAVWRIDSPDDVEGLANAIVALHDDPAARAERSRRTADLAARLIPSWEERIDSELKLLDAIADKART